jgi:hypothetical protein
VPVPSPGAAPPASPFRFGERPRPSKDPEKTLQVTPPRKRQRGLRLLGLLATTILLLLGFSLSSSLAGQISASRVWMLAAGLLSAVLLPALVASWLRAMLRRRNRRGPGTIAALVTINLLLLLGAALLAPGATRRALHQHGSWWVGGIAELLGKDAKNPAVVGAGSVFRWLGDRLPGTPMPEPRVTGPSTPAPDGRAARGALDGGVASVPADLAARHDLGASGPAGEIRVAFEKRGTAIVVPVKLTGAGGQVLEARMLFDTGASISTLDEKTLRAIGQTLPPDSPTIETMTANGVVRRSLTVIEGIELGSGAVVQGGVTVTLCEPCASGGTVGLLGLNFSRHFTVTLDHEAGQILLRRRALAGGRVLDIKPFVELGEAKGHWKGPLLTVECVVQSRAPRALRNLRIAALVKEGGREGKIWGELKELPARGRQPLTLQGLPPLKAPSFLLQLEQAEW